MKIYIDKTETLWVDVKTKDSRGIIEEAPNGFITYYRVVSGMNIVSGKFKHYEDLTMEEKYLEAENNLKELIK